jgi:hypothetical protein
VAFPFFQNSKVAQRSIAFPTSACGSAHGPLDPARQLCLAPFPDARSRAASRPHLDPIVAGCSTADAGAPCADDDPGCIVAASASAPG